MGNFWVVSVLHSVSDITTSLTRRRAVLFFRSVAYVQRSICVPVGTGDGALFAVGVFNRGYAAAQLVEALRYNPEGRGFDSRRCHWRPSGRTMALGLTQPLTEMSTRNNSWG
jgi:hypothetical protein